MARIIVDNLSSQFTYGGGNWSSVAVSHFYGGDATWPDFARGNNSDTGVYGSLTFTFQGSYFTLYIKVLQTYNFIGMQGRLWHSSAIHRPQGILNGLCILSMAVNRTIHHSWILLPPAPDSGISLRLFPMDNTILRSHISQARLLTTR